MGITRIIAIPIMGILLVIGACTDQVIVPPESATKTIRSETVAAIPLTTKSTPAATTPIILAPAPGPAGLLTDDMNYIVQVTPTQGQVSFHVSQLQLDPEDVELGYDVTISVMVMNTGEQRGTYTVVLKFGDAIIETKDVTIDRGGSRKVEFNFIPAVPCGDYKVLADKLTTRLRVLW